MINSFLNFLEPFAPYSYAVIFLVLIICGLGIPIPEDITLVVGGITAYYNITNYWMTVLVAIIGVLAGDGIIFMIGYYFGARLLKSRWFSKVIKPKRVALARLSFAKYGNYLIFFARFMPGLRTPIYFSIGMFKRPFYIFFLIDGFASIISVPVWVYVGMIFAKNIPLLEHYVHKMEHGILITVAVVIIIIILFHYIKKKYVSHFFKKQKNNTSS
jgi:membrane protein DedA with SNARE-associated domain